MTLVNIRNNHPSIMSSFFAFSEKLASFLYLKWAMIALLPVTDSAEISCGQVNDHDLWWQMALGKYYLTHHTLIMDHSIFSWTPTDPAWIYNTCLGSIVIYLFYNLMGGFGLWIFQWLIFLGVFLSFYLFLRLIRQRFDVTSVTDHCRHWYRLRHRLQLLQAGIVFTPPVLLDGIYLFLCQVDPQEVPFLSLSLHFRPLGQSARRLHFRSCFSCSRLHRRTFKQNFLSQGILYH